MPLNLQSLGKKAKEAAFQLSQCSTEQKNRALKFIAEQIEQQSDVILSANELDMNKAKENGTSDTILDRLLLTEERLTAIANDVRKVISLTDPVGQIIDGSNLDNGLTLYRRKVPLGVIGVIYEARPNVTIDIASLCIKTGNAVILRGGKETIHTNEAMINVIQTALSSADLPEYSVQSINHPDRKYITELLKLDRYVDMIIPRGGSALQKLCIEQSTIPVITGGIGVCHIFVDENADFDKALSIIVNAKTQRPSTCNTVETLIIHSRIIDAFLPKFVKAMKDNQIVLHADVRAFSKLSNLIDVEKVQDEELRREWLSKDLNVILVDSLEDAVAHIREYGSSHSDAILTKNLSNAEKFVNLVNSAAVYVNASTRFTDGAQFGLGAEVAISTQKLHARGPMGLDTLTTYKWIGYGDDLIRK